VPWKTLAKSWSPSGAPIAILRPSTTVRLMASSEPVTKLHMRGLALWAAAYAASRGGVSYAGSTLNETRRNAGSSPRARCWMRPMVAVMVGQMVGQRVKMKPASQTWPSSSVEPNRRPS
jgi:hypothetical protein